jgi:MFS family permease
MATPAPTTVPVPDRWSSWLLTGLFLAAAALLFGLLYVVIPQHQHYVALLLIGVLALFFALGSYLAESFSRQPTAQRSLAWGFFGLGFAVLFLSIGLGRYYGLITLAYQLLGLLLTVIVLIVTVALIGWRGRALRRTANREIPRQAWRNEPAPSAFSYAAANSPSVPEASPPPARPPTAGGK